MANIVPLPGKCANCGYPLGDWASPICPECGTDVRRKRGVIAPSQSNADRELYVLLTTVPLLGGVAYGAIVLGPALSNAWIGLAGFFLVAIAVVYAALRLSRSYRQQLVCEPYDNEWCIWLLAGRDDD
ncbi:MAG: hypothetical protein AAF432_14815 [Planctomycetota bacterium]